MYKKTRILLAMVVLVSASLACQAVMGGGVPKPPAAPSPVQQAAPTRAQPTQAESGAPTAAPAPDSIEAAFPMPEDAENVVDMGADLLNFQTKLSLKDVIAFYREAFSKQGYTERNLLTTIADSTFSLVFDGHTSGKAIIIQGVDMGNGTVNVNITLQDM